jgi:protein transport protein SEC13
VAGSSDGSVSIATSNADQTQWKIEYLRESHKSGCNAVSCSPNLEQFATGGGDHHVKIWRLNSQGEWKMEQQLDAHQDWVRDVAWAPNIGLQYDTVASGSQDRMVIIWQSSEKGGRFVKKQEMQFKATVWRLSWSVTGNLLAVTTSDNGVFLFKEDIFVDCKIIDPKH